MGLYWADICAHDPDSDAGLHVDKPDFEKRAGERVHEEGQRWGEVAPVGSGTTIALARGFGSWGPEKVDGWDRGSFAVYDTAAGAADAFEAQGVDFEDEPGGFPHGTHARVRDPRGDVFGLLGGARG